MDMRIPPLTLKILLESKFRILVRRLAVLETPEANKKCADCVERGPTYICRRLGLQRGVLGRPAPALSRAIHTHANAQSSL